MRLTSLQCVLIEEALIRLEEARPGRGTRNLALADLVEDIGRALQLSSSTQEWAQNTSQQSWGTVRSLLNSIMGTLAGQGAAESPSDANSKP